MQWNESKFYILAEQPKDTAADDVTANTYVPRCATFEMDLMENYKLQ